MATKILTSSGTTRLFEKECKEIHDSWGRMNQLLHAFAGRTQKDRQKIRETYQQMYDEDLLNLLQQANMSPKARAAVSLWMLNPHERDATIAREALDHQQGEPNYKALAEIFVCRKSSHIVFIKQAYQTKYARILDQDIITIEPPHPYQKILMALATSHKAHHADVSQHVAKCDSRRLYEAGEGRPGAIDEAVVLEILTKRSIQQLKLTFSCYNRIYGHEYNKSIKKGISREFEDSVETVVKCINDPPNYYAKVLHGSIRGRTADRGAVTRVIVSRAELDMDEIQRVFKKNYEMGFREAICDHIPSGDYRDFLLALAAKSDPDA